MRIKDLKKIILASESPRRKLLLQQLGLEFECSPSNITEDLSVSASPPELARSIATQKAMQIASGLDEGIVIAADTVVTLAGNVMGKPTNREEACFMLSCLSGQCHQVITGVCIIDAANKIPESAFECTDVFFRPLSSQEINNYLDYGEWGDKAGAYAIQGRGALLIDRIQGCYFNVVGLPLNRLNLMLRSKGLDLLEVNLPCSIQH
jgi:septum formation protein